MMFWGRKEIEVVPSENEENGGSAKAVKLPNSLRGAHRLNIHSYRLDYPSHSIEPQWRILRWLTNAHDNFFFNNAFLALHKNS
jgi:hypothetical protein